MSAGTDFLASLQKATVKNTVQQKQKKRETASAVDVSALLAAALKPKEAVAGVRQSTEAATASFLPSTDTQQDRSTQQKPKEVVDPGITALIQNALAARKVMTQPDIA